MYFKLSVILSVVLLSACSHFEHHHSNVHHPDETTSNNATNSHESHTSNKSSLKLRLNGDDKWLMDEHTRSVTLVMANRFSSIDIDAHSQQELTQLGEQLSLDLDKLIQGCTMEGASHNALHDFLTGFIPELEKLKTTGSVSSAKHVQYQLTEYQKYFE